MKIAHCTPLSALVCRIVCLLTMLAVLAVTPKALAQGYALTVLHNFSAVDGNQYNTDGAYPSAPLILSDSSFFYGTTSSGAYGHGTLFRFVPTEPLDTLHTFSVTSTNGSNSDGADPAGAILEKISDANLYGMTGIGGTNGTGLIYQLSPEGGLYVQYTFSALDGNRHNSDGADPSGALILGTDGNFYGVASFGGANGDGTVFKLTPTGGFTTLHNFTGSDGSSPSAGLVQGSDGNLYGVTSSGGANYTGTIFKISTSGTFTLLHSFAAINGLAGNNATNSDGDAPSSALLQGTDGNFYGVTKVGGPNGGGTIYQISSMGSFADIHFFSAVNSNGVNSDGSQPTAALIQGSDGNFYGTTAYGGANGTGTVFEVTPSGTLTPLYGFSAVDSNSVNTDGAYPTAALLQTSDGAFYGTAQAGGSGGTGVIFRLNIGGTVQFDSTVYTVAENGGSATITVTRAGGSSNAITVNYATADGTATAGQDYYAESGMLSWAEGDTSSKAISVPIIDRQLTSGSVTVSLTLNQPGGGATLGSPAQATLTIFDNDPAPTPTVSPSPGVTPTPTPGITPTPTPAVTPTPTPTVSPSPGVTPTPTPTPVVTPTPINSPTPSPSASPSPGVTPTPTPTPVVTPTPTPTPTPGITPTPTPVVTPTPDNSPTAQLVFPPNNLTVPNGVSLTLVASLTDPFGTAAKVQFISNGQPIESAITVAPGAGYSVNYRPPSAGFFEISVAVTDRSGNSQVGTTGNVEINVIDPPPGEAVGGIQFQGGLDQRTLAAGSTVNIAAQLTAGDNSGLSSVTFYADNVQIAAFDATGTPTTSGHAPGDGPTRKDAASSPVFQTAYPLPGTSKVVNLIAVALTKAGLSATSSPVTLNVEANVQPPTITLNAPAATAVARVDQDFTINAQATQAANPIARVQYYAGTQKMADVTNPSVFAFDFTPTGAGPTVLSAVVTDSTGLSSGSPPLTVNVLPVAPTVTVTGSASIEEGNKGKIVVQRNGDTTSAINVRYKVTGDAEANTDYKRLSGTVTILAGETAAKIKLKTLRNAAAESVRMVKIKLVPATDGSYTLGDQTTAKLKILGND